MRALAIDLDSDVPVYRQIADELRGRAARGHVEPGMLLPSVRALGKELGVNLNTVAKAYRILAEEGLIELKQGAGARIASTIPRSGRPHLDSEAARRLRETFDRWVLAGGDRRQVEALLARAVDAYFSERSAEEP